MKNTKLCLKNEQYDLKNFIKIFLMFIILNNIPLKGIPDYNVSQNL